MKVMPQFLQFHKSCFFPFLFKDFYLNTENDEIYICSKINTVTGS